MRVLVACEESQQVCKAFRARGFEAYSCDLVECSGGHPEWHIQADALDTIVSQHWDLLIAHPPCTYLSKCGARWLFPRGELNLVRYEQMLKAREFFMAVYNAPVEHVAVENPISLKLAALPDYTQQIQPWQFGHPVTKATRLWLRGLPKLQPTNVVKPNRCFVQSSANRSWKAGGRYKTANTAKERSKTFSGVAEAMAKQWGDFLKGKEKQEEERRQEKCQ